MSARWRPLLLVPACALAFGCARGGDEVNVLLISLDSTRRDFLSCYGRVSPHAADVPTTPHIDALAGEGVRFDAAYSTTSWTLPSHMALMTGQPDMVHAVELDQLTLGDGHVTLAQALADTGYRTAGFYSGPYLDGRYGFARGFERYEASYGDELSQAIAKEARIKETIGSGEQAPERAVKLLKRLQKALLQVEKSSHRDVSSEKVTESVLGELASAREDSRPWFVFAHYFDPHFDYAPPAPFHERFDPDYPGQLDASDFANNPGISVPDPTLDYPGRRRRTVSERDLAHVRALYDGEMAWTDHQVGRIIDDLRKHGELDDTIVIVVADHGDEFFEHANIGHRNTLFEEVLRIPFILRFPPKLGGGQVVSEVVSIADVFATIFELLELPLPSGLLSRSAVPLATKKSDGGDRYAFARLIDTRPVTGRDGSMGLNTAVHEAFILWPIKIMRTRRWVEPASGVSPEDRAVRLREAEQERSRESRIEWIDLERSPEEHPGEFSSDFADSRVAGALTKYREVYDRLLALRRPPPLSDQDEGQRSLLRGLGYGGGPGEEGLEEGMVGRFTISAPEVP